MMRRRIGRPGLVGTAARTAVVVGTASAVSNKMSNKAQQKADQQAAASQQAVAAQQAQAAPAPATAPAADDMFAKLERLADLRSKGILTEEEFAAQKAKILG